MALDRSKVLQQAQLFASRGQYDQAMAEWKKLAAEIQNDGSIYNSIGDLHLKRNAVVEATAAFFQAATAFKTEGATLKAIAAYKKVLKYDPARYEVYCHLGDLNTERGLVSSAVQDYLALAKHYVKERKPKEALELYKKIVSIDPANLNAQQRIAEICLQENQQDEATNVYLQLGRERSAQGSYEEAKNAYLAVLRIDPKNSEARQFVEGMRKGVASPIPPPTLGEAASGQWTSEPLGPLAEAVRRIDEQQYEGAEAILNQMLSREPGNPQVCQLLARLHLQRGDVQRGDLQVALGEYRFLAGAALRAKDLILAEYLIQEFLSVQPDSVPLLELYGELYEEQQDHAAAARQYARAMELLLAHPEPGMEGLHEELFEKVRLLSTDAELVDRLTATLKGESAGISPDSVAGSIKDRSESIGQAIVPSQADEGVIAEVNVDNPSAPVAQVRMSQNADLSLQEAEPDGERISERKASVEVDGFVLTNAAPDGTSPFERKAPLQPGSVVVTNAVPDGDGLRGMTRHQEETPYHIVDATVPLEITDLEFAPDYEAHFTLGVAYKNMGLYAEAREQFDVSRRGERFSRDSCVMTVLCWKEEGRCGLAAQELELALSNPRNQGEGDQHLRYELGLLYETESQWAKAVATFQCIPLFQDVPQRLRALEDRSRIQAGELRLAS